MRLLFLGDIGTASGPVAPPPRLPAADLVIANLEGAILDDAELEQHTPRKFVALHSSPAIRLDDLGLAIDHKAQGPLERDHRKRFEGCVQGETADRHMDLRECTGT